MQATTSVYPGYPKTIAIHGDRGSAVIEQDDILKWDFTPETPDDAKIRMRFAHKTGASGGASDPAAISHEGHRRQLSDFVQAIGENRPPLVDGRDGRKSVALICAIYEAARTGIALLRTWGAGRARWVEGRVNRLPGLAARLAQEGAPSATSRD